MQIEIISGGSLTDIYTDTFFISNTNTDTDITQIDLPIPILGF